MPCQTIRMRQLTDGPRKKIANGSTHRLMFKSRTSHFMYTITFLQKRRKKTDHHIAVCTRRDYSANAICSKSHN